MERFVHRVFQPLPLGTVCAACRASSKGVPS